MNSLACHILRSWVCFTSILNSRLNELFEMYKVLNKNQAGFRKGYSTLDHIHVLHSLINIFKCQKRKLFCAFIDYEKAFDKIWRDGMWYKLMKYGIKGKILSVIENMYKGIKSCVITNKSNISDFFESRIGLRQGENLSPILFSIYVNDLETYLVTQGNKGISVGNYTDIDVYVKLLVLMYADDTVLLSDSAAGLQKALNSLEQYCKDWKLNVNCNKTKVVVFGGRSSQAKYSFRYGDKCVDIVTGYKYLGVYFNENASFAKCKDQLVKQAERAMFGLLNRCRALHLPIDIQLELFDKIVVPILTYGSEIWGYENVQMLESLHLRFLKYILSVKRSTPNFMVYGELGRFNLQIGIKTKIISFWAKMMSEENDKYSKQVYVLARKLYDKKFIKCKWLDCVKGILNECGLSNIWEEAYSSNINVIWLKTKIKQTLQDQFTQKWHSEMQNSNKAINYRLYKTDFKFEVYLLKLPDFYRMILTRFRLGCSKLPVERGRYQNVDRDRRFCQLCNDNKIGDEFHIMLECKNNTLVAQRKSLFPQFCLSRPNVLKFCSLMNDSDLISLVKYLVQCNKLL